MNRYLLFACDTYYPNGGWGDFRSSHDSLKDALVAAANCRSDRWEVVDLERGGVVEFGYTGEDRP